MQSDAAYGRRGLDDPDRERAECACDAGADAILDEPRWGASLADKPRTIALPIAGHEVSIALEPGAQYVVSTGGNDPETAWDLNRDDAVQRR